MAEKILSINMESDKHVPAVRSFIEREEPQIIALQEVFKSDSQQFADMYGMQSLFLPMSKKMTAKNTGGGESEEIGVALLSTYPFLSHTVEYYFGSEQVTDYWKPEKVSRGVLWATIHCPQEDVTIAATHFTWTPDGLTSDLQRKELPKLMAILKKSRPHVLIGDLNAARGQEIFDALAKEYTDNIPQAVLTTIDPNLHRVKNLQLVVDALFSSPEYRVSNVRVESGISDHCGVVGLVERV